MFDLDYKPLLKLLRLFGNFREKIAKCFVKSAFFHSATQVLKSYLWFSRLKYYIIIVLYLPVFKEYYYTCRVFVRVR